MRYVRQSQQHERHCYGFLSGICGGGYFSGLPQFATVGLPDASVKESRDRIKSAIKIPVTVFPAVMSPSIWRRPILKGRDWF